MVFEYTLAVAFLITYVHFLSSRLYIISAFLNCVNKLKFNRLTNTAALPMETIIAYIGPVIIFTRKYCIPDKERKEIHAYVLT